MRKTNDRTLYAVLSLLVDRIELALSCSNQELRYHGVAEVPVMMLLKELKPPTAVIDFVVKRYLAIFRKSNRRSKLFSNFEALNAAGVAAHFGASRRVSETLVREMAKYGFLRAERAAIQLLGRGLRAREVVWLVDSYVSDKAIRSAHTEGELMRLAHVYMPAEEAGKVRVRIEEFVEAFNSAID